MGQERGGVLVAHAPPCFVGQGTGHDAGLADRDGEFDVPADRDELLIGE
ncbi:hypothetical protein [Embleya sp. AB8]